MPISISQQILICNSCENGRNRRTERDRGVIVIDKGLSGMLGKGHTIATKPQKGGKILKRFKRLEDTMLLIYNPTR